MRENAITRTNVDKETPSGYLIQDVDQVTRGNGIEVPPRRLVFLPAAHSPARPVAVSPVDLAETRGGPGHGSSVMTTEGEELEAILAGTDCINTTCAAETVISQHLDLTLLYADWTCREINKLTHSHLVVLILFL